MPPFRSVLVANRGEIAVRVVRACRDLGIRAVAVFSDADADALHVRLADEAYPLGPAEARRSYLDGAKLIEVARRAGVDAVHPGYGFLAESAAFAAAVAGAGLVFVGPPADVQRALGDKTAARRLAQSLGIPIAEGTLEPIADLGAARETARRIGYPLLLKPAAGGGGKGMRIVREEAELADAWRGASGEALSAFGAPALLVERLVEGARHIEVQLLADSRGEVIALGERDCSVQRRHQKLIEETPAASLAPAVRATLVEAALRLARAAGYRNAGTVEFLLDARGQHVFLEVNTRLQVEHPVTEVVTGLDLVALQLRVAAGEPLPFAQADIAPRGAAIELRITSEDPFTDFTPAGGRVSIVREPSGPGVRVDSALVPGMRVPTEYDPLLAKLVVWGRDRAEALARARRAVAETIVAGVPTTLPFHAWTLRDAEFVAAQHDTSFVTKRWPAREPVELGASATAAAALAAVLATRRRAEAPPTVVAQASEWARAGRLESTGRDEALR